MGKLLNFVFLLLFASGRFCESNSQDGCHSIVKENQLTISNCGDGDIKKIADFIRQETNVVTIDISNAGLTSIDEIDLHQNGQLKKFDASKNKIGEFPKKCLSSSLTVEEINLSANNLIRFDFKDFVENSRLASINLASNEISELYMPMHHWDFSPLKHLKFVDLSKNVISTLYSAIFCPDCVVTLHLEENRLSSLDTQLFRIKDNISIYFSWAKMTSISFFGHSKRFHVALDDKYEWIQAIRDENLNYQHEIHCGEQSMEAIDNLYVTENQVENLSTLLQCLGPSVKTLQLSGNFLGSLNHTVFQRFVNLTDLRVANTQLVDFDFSVIGIKMNYLDLSLNNVKTVSNPSKLTKFMKLKYFDVSGNHMQNTPELIASLHKSAELWNLNLCDNYIGRLSKTTFANLKKARMLKLCNTQIEITDFNPFEDLKQLAYLDISNNNLENVDFAVMAATLKSLPYLEASNCQIRNISDVFQHFGHAIVGLDLSRNSASNLSANLFESFTRLNVLNLSHLHMTEPREMDLSSVPYSVEELHINDNRLKSITNLEGFSVPITFNIVGNCFSPEIMNRILANITGIGSLLEPFTQKSKEECSAYDRQMPHSSGNGDSTRVIIIAVISIVTAVIVCVSFIYREKLYGKIRTAFDVTKAKITKSNSNQCAANAEVITPNEPIYEELDDYVRYDRLWHEFQPMPLSKQTEEVYDATNSPRNSSIK